MDKLKDSSMTLIIPKYRHPESRLNTVLLTERSTAEAVKLGHYSALNTKWNTTCYARGLVSLVKQQLTSSTHFPVVC